MYEVIVTDDFVNAIREIPIKYAAVFTKSFLSIKRIDQSDNVFMDDLLEQIKNQEIE